MTERRCACVPFVDARECMWLRYEGDIEDDETCTCACHDDDGEDDDDD